MIVPITDGETIVRNEKLEIGILLAREEVTITHARYPPGEPVAGRHVHHEHTDAFYVLEGKLTFEIGPEAEMITVASGGFVAVPPEVAHSFRTDGEGPARWLTIHAHDGGFAAFMRGVRDGIEVEWDISPLPSEGGLPASRAVVSLEDDGERMESGNRVCCLKCALPDISVVEWRLGDAQGNVPLHRQGRRVDSFLLVEGELDVTLTGTRRIIGPGTLISLPRGGRHTLASPRSKRARMLSIHTPDGGFADYLRRSPGGNDPRLG